MNAPPQDSEHRVNERLTSHTAVSGSGPAFSLVFSLHFTFTSLFVQLSFIWDFPRAWLPHLQAGTKPTFVPHFFSCCPASVRSPTVRSPILSQLFSLYLILLEVNEENEQWVVRERKLERSAHTHCTSLRSRLSFFSFPSHSLIL